MTKTREEFARRIAEQVKSSLRDALSINPLVWDLVDETIREELLATEETAAQIWLDPFKNQISVKMFGCDEPLVREFFVAGLDLYTSNPSQEQADQMWGGIVGAKRLVAEINAEIDKAEKQLTDLGFAEPRRFTEPDNTSQDDER